MTRVTQKMLRNANKLRTIDRRQIYEDQQVGETGKLDSNGNLINNASVGLDEGFIWVRLGETEETRSRTAVSVRTLKSYRAGVLVTTEYNRVKKRREITGEPVELVDQLGAAAAASVASGTDGSIVTGLVSPASLLSLDVFPNTSKNENGGFWVTFGSGMYAQGNWFAGGTPDGDYEATNAPGSGKKAYILFGLDRDGTPFDDISADRSTTYQFIFQDLLDVIASYPADVTWKAAILVHDGDTTYNLSRKNSYIPLGQVFGRNAKNNFSATTDPGVGDDVDDGYVNGSLWLNTSSGELFYCADNTAGAAVWTSATAGSVSSPLTTKGDIYVYGSSDTRLPAGTDGYVLTTDSGETTGLKWAANTSILNRVNLYDDTLGSNGEWDVASIDQGYDDLELIIEAASAASVANDTLYIFLNNDTTAANYQYARVGASSSGTYGGGSSIPALTLGLPGASSSSSPEKGTLKLLIAGYTDTTFHHQIVANNVVRFNSTLYGEQHVVSWNVTPAAINRIQIRLDGYSSDHLLTGSRLRIFGLKN